MRVRLVKPLLALVFGAISACGANHRAGHLLIAGGGTSPDNQLIYSRFIGPLAPDAVIGIIPTASANTKEAGASAARTISRYAGERRIEQFDISVQSPGAASDPEVVRRIRQCSALWFTGGVQSRITQVFRPAAGDTPAYAAACEVLARGGVIGGTSAGAAMMSDPMIAGGTSEQALSGKFRGEGGDEDSGFGLAQGMGFFPFGLTDQHFLRRGRLGRLIIALERTRISRGYGVEEGSALYADLGSGVLTALGQVLVVDVDELARREGAITGVRISLLNAGDTVEGPTGRVNLPAERATIPEAASAVTEPLPGAWSRGAVTVALQRLAVGEQVCELRSEGWILRLSRSAKTAVWRKGEQWSVDGVSLELHPIAAGGSTLR